MIIYTPVERQAILERLLDEFRRDKRVGGVVIVGSAADGFDDEVYDVRGSI